MEALLSLDLGTTGCKATVCSLRGEVLGTSYLECPLETPAPGWVEQDAGLWWTLAQRAIRQALVASSVSLIRVLAVSVSSQGISFVPVDRAGRILRRAICWLDTRAEEEAAQIGAALGDEEIFQVTGKRPSPTYVLPKLLWLRRHEPDVCRQTHKFLLAHDLVIYRLCGAFVTDYSLAGGTLLLDLHRLGWSERLLATFAIDPAQLPEPVWAGTLAGELSLDAAAALGLRAGLPVVVGGQDQKCAALGAGLRSSRATVSLGTAAAISCLVKRPALDASRRVPTFPFVAPGQWVLEGVVGTAGAALRWLRDTFFPTCGYAELDRWAAASPPGARGVRFHPHLAGATSPLWQAGVRGVFTGLSLATSSGDIVRSVLEGVACQVRANLEVMETLAPVEELVLFGGGAQSILWPRLIGEITGKPVSVTETVDVANWGACILAGCGAGLFADRLALALTSQPVPCSIPSACYDALYQDYRQGETHLFADPVQPTRKSCRRPGERTARRAAPRKRSL